MSIEQIKIEQKEVCMFKNTAEFKSAISKGELCKSEDWLEHVKKNRTEFLNYDDRWVDLAELELFRSYRKEKDFDGGNRVIENMDENNAHAQEHNSKQGRINVLSDEIEKYNKQNN